MAVVENNGNGRRKSPFSSSVYATILKTIGSVLVTMLGLTFVTFIIGRVMPIDPVISIVGERASKETYDAAYQAMGLDKPILVQFFYYIWDVLHGDFGVSTLTSRAVIDDIKRVFPATMELASVGTIFGVLFGVPLGVISAVKRGTWIDHVARFFSLVGYSAPIFWLGLMGLMIFYGYLGWVGEPGRLSVYYVDLVPTVTGLLLVDSMLDGNWVVFNDAFKHVILPASILGYYSVAYISRMTRSFMLEQMSAEYITTARVKGLPERTVVWRHAFGNIKVQLITVVALSYANLLEGAVLTETIFAWPGIGQYITTALLSADMNAVLGGTVVVGLIFVLLNIFSDLLYRFFDPRAAK